MTDKGIWRAYVFGKMPGQKFSVWKHLIDGRSQPQQTTREAAEAWAKQRFPTQASFEAYWRTAEKGGPYKFAEETQVSVWGKGSTALVKATPLALAAKKGPKRAVAKVTVTSVKVNPPPAEDEDRQVALTLKQQWLREGAEREMEKAREQYQRYERQVRMALEVA